MPNFNVKALKLLQENPITQVIYDDTCFEFADARRASGDNGKVNVVCGFGDYRISITTKQVYKKGAGKESI
jgi:hypothetical protein